MFNLRLYSSSFMTSGFIRSSIVCNWQYAFSNSSNISDFVGDFAMNAPAVLSNKNHQKNLSSGWRLATIKYNSVVYSIYSRTLQPVVGEYVFARLLYPISTTHRYVVYYI